MTCQGSGSSSLSVTLISCVFGKQTDGTDGGKVITRPAGGGEKKQQPIQCSTGRSIAPCVRLLQLLKWEWFHFSTQGSTSGYEGVQRVHRPCATRVLMPKSTSKFGVHQGARVQTLNHIPLCFGCPCVALFGFKKGGQISY
jgi:hypothetical protein